MGGESQAEKDADQSSADLQAQMDKQNAWEQSQSDQAKAEAQTKNMAIQRDELKVIRQSMSGKRTIG